VDRAEVGFFGAKELKALKALITEVNIYKATVNSALGCATLYVSFLLSVEV
jgi:hypothetical protein